jgi:hypothetical protein
MYSYTLYIIPVIFWNTNLCQNNTSLLRHNPEISLLIWHKKLYDCVKVTLSSLEDRHKLVKYFTVTFQVSTAVYIEIMVFWNVTPCSSVNAYQLKFMVNHLKVDEAGFFEILLAILWTMLYYHDFYSSGYRIPSITTLESAWYNFQRRFLQLQFINLSMPASVYCTDLQFLTCCRPRCTVP